MTLEQRAVLKLTDQPLPKWKDETGVAALVDDCIARRTTNIAGTISFERGDARGIMFLESLAVGRAKRGDPTVLATLLRSGQRLQPGTIELAIELMTGERNPQTGKCKGEVGRNKMTPAEKKAKYPLRYAAAEFDVIRGLLRQHYPSEPRRAIRERALELAAERAGVEPGRLDSYINTRGVRTSNSRLRKTDRNLP
jgi:hypothetical protein